MLLDTSQHLIVVRGGGDLATGIIYRLQRAGFPTIVLELPEPLVVRRTVAVAAAVLSGEATVEGMVARRVDTTQAALALAKQNIIPVLPSPQLPEALQPTVLVDARMAKRNIDTSKSQAALVVALGPGFTAGVDCHAVVETMRGHRLGRVIWEGAALPDTGTPGIVAGKGAERVLRAPKSGRVSWQVAIGDSVTARQVMGHVDDAAVVAPFAGVVRGLIMDGLSVRERLKIGDVDARGDRDACFSISDKALAIAGGVLEAILTAQCNAEIR